MPQAHQFQSIFLLSTGQPSYRKTDKISDSPYVMSITVRRYRITAHPYHRGCQDKAPCRSPRSDTDPLAFEACTVGQSHHVDLNLPLTMAWLWIHQYGLSSTAHCPYSTPTDMKAMNYRKNNYVIDMLTVTLVDQATTNIYQHLVKHYTKLSWVILVSFSLHPI